jgi:5-methylcytosine-specific restriction endonuclease McrA
MNLKKLDDQTLIATTEKLVREERELLTKVLHHLREINHRRLFSALGYKSLFDFTVRRLGYPEDQAYRRIAAMKVVRELPEIEEKISQGRISLTHIGLAHSLFKQEKKIQQKEMSPQEKLAVFTQISGKSVRQAEKITLSLSSVPETVKADRIVSVSENQIELKLMASAELRNKIETLKGWLAHSHPDMNLGELFNKLCDLGLQEWDHSKTAAPRKRRVIAHPNLQNRNQESASNLKEDQAKMAKSQSLAQMRREVFRKAQNKCENCGSEYALEIDHRKPKAFGGSNSPDNLRLLCRACNQRAAISKLGMRKMEAFLN